MKPGKELPIYFYVTHTILFSDGHSLNFGPVENDIFGTLIRAKGKPVTTDMLANQIERSAIDELKDAKGEVAVIFLNLKRKLSEFGIITGQSGRRSSGGVYWIPVGQVTTDWENPLK